MRVLAPKRNRSNQAAPAGALSKALAHRPAHQASPVPCRLGGSANQVVLWMPFAGDFSRIPPRSPVALAEAGMKGGGEPLPHLAEIQRSFGRHDISSVVAHLGPPAAAAARALGASAYTTGDRTAFAGPPDLRIAAHEAAHVVQQRADVHLSGDLGEVGDVYEWHADAVADYVVRGRSAEAPLNQMAPAGSAS